MSLFDNIPLGSPQFGVGALMCKSCCCRRKVSCFKKLSQKTTEHVCYEFYAVSETEQTHNILKYMREHGHVDGTVLYSVGGEEICETAFHSVYGLRYNRFKSIKCKYASGVIVPEHGRRGRGQYTYSTIRAISWLRMFIDKVGDLMAMKQKYILTIMPNEVRCLCVGC